MSYFITMIIGYLLGAIPFGLIFAQVFGKGDVRKIGSGNIGATNVLRTGSKPAAIFTLLFDGLKGFAAVYLAGRIFGTNFAYIAGIAALIGHCYPVFLNFRGGKGVATYIGVVFGFSQVFMGAATLGLIACGLWLATALLMRISSLSALVMATLMPLVAIFIVGFGPMVLILALIGAFIIFRHKDNIKRIRAGEEPKIGKSSKS